jgi:uncharacterized membrane protein YgcG
MMPNRRSILKRGGLALFGAGALSQVETPAQAQRAATKTEDCNCTHAPDGSPLDIGTSEVRPVIERYQVELRDVERVYALPGSVVRQAKLEGFYAEQVRLLDAIHFDALSQPGKVDYLLLRSRLGRERKQLADEAKLDAEIAPLIPFQQTIIAFEEARRRMETVDGQKSAAALAQLSADLAAARAANAKANPAALNRAAIRLAQLRNSLRTWYNFYALYDPKFGWWVDAEYKKADEALDAHAQLLHTSSGMPGALDAGGGGRGGRGGGGGRGGRAGGADAGGAAAGRGGAPARTAALGSNEELSGVGPAGNAVLVDSLGAAMIAYTPDELVALANKEFAWCDKEMLRASGEMGFGADWKKRWRR